MDEQMSHGCWEVLGWGWGSSLVWGTQRKIEGASIKGPEANGDSWWRR